MLTHKNRFHGHGSLRYVYRNGHTARNRLLSVRYSANKNRVHSRVAIIIAKKVVKSAVRRNRIRRRLFEVVRLEWPHIEQKSDIAITVFSAEFLTMSPKDVHDCLVDVLKQAHLYRPDAQSDTLEEIS